MLKLHVWNTALRRALWALLLAGVASCARAEREPLRIGVNPWPGYELFFLADEMNFFEAEGVEVRLVEQVSLKDSRRVYVRGMVDGMLGTPMDLAAINAKGSRPAVAQCAISYSSGADAIVAKQSIRTVDELRGALIAIEEGLGDYFLARALESVGMTVDDVRVAYLPYPVAEEALRAGDVDAIHTFSPILHRLTRGNQPYHVIFSSRDTPGEIVDLLIVDPHVAATRGEDLRRVERAYDRACRFVVDHPERAYRIMAERERVAGDEMAKTFREDLTLIQPNDRAGYLAPGGEAVKSADRFRAMALARAENVEVRGHERNRITDRHVLRPDLNP